MLFSCKGARYDVVRNYLGKLPLTTFFLIIAIPVVLYLLFIVNLYLVQSRHIYCPTAEIATTPDKHGLEFEAIDFETSDGLMLHGWFVPRAAGADQACRERVVLFFHGNTGNISDCIATLAMFHQLGLSTFIFDYRGYGRSQGGPTEQGTYDDAEAAWIYLLRDRGIKSEDIIVMGRSLGAAIAAAQAARHTPGVLVIESTFTSAPELAAELFRFVPARLMSRFKYNVRDNIANTHCPVLVVHSSDDEVIPFHHGKRLYDVANEPKAFLEINGAHAEGFYTTGQDYIDGLKRFLDQRFL